MDKYQTTDKVICTGTQTCKNACGHGVKHVKGETWDTDDKWCTAWGYCSEIAKKVRCTKVKE